MTYEESSAAWAKKKFDLEGEVTGVEFETYDTGGGCETCDYGREEGMTVTFRLNDKYTSKDIPYASVTQIVQEIVNT